MKIVVVTALIGPAESVAPPPRYSPSVSYVCFTDRQDVDGWHCWPAPGASDPRRAARIVKTTMDEWFDGADVTIWLDASFDLKVDPNAIVHDAAATGCDVAGFAHPDRSRIRDEAAEIARLGMAPADAVARQVEAYRAEAFDTDAEPQRVLTTTGLLVRMQTPAVAAFNRLWREQIERHTIRDQLSIDYCAWRTGVTIGHLPGHYRANRYAEYNRARHRLGRIAA